jgi:hypothetical protein
MWSQFFFPFFYFFFRTVGDSFETGQTPEASRTAPVLSTRTGNTRWKVPGGSSCTEPTVDLKLKLFMLALCVRGCTATSLIYVVSPFRAHGRANLCSWFKQCKLFLKALYRSIDVIPAALARKYAPSDNKSLLTVVSVLFLAHSCCLFAEGRAREVSTTGV